MPFSQLGLHDRLVQGVRAAGFDAPTTIQSQAIPRVLAGNDIVGLANTGTGKTAAFVLPMLHRFSSNTNARRAVRGLVLTPTRELARQIEDSIALMGRFTNVSALSVYGGTGMEKQIQRLRRGVDVVVATPGRLLDHLNRRTIDLSAIEYLVVDEADRMFDMGFIRDVRKIVSHTPHQRQTLLFSATMPESIRHLTQVIQKNPELIQVGETANPAAGITQYFYAVAPEQKLSLLAHILEKEKMESVLVFSRTKHGADKVSGRLERKGFATTAIHSNRTQSQRQHALAGFKQGRYRILVATDIAARGIDVEGISHVINFDTPMAPEDYIHRVGRTGRAEKNGDAITFVSNAERKYFLRIQQMLGKKMELKARLDFHPSPAGAEARSERDQEPSRSSKRKNEKKRGWTNLGEGHSDNKHDERERRQRRGRNDRRGQTGGASAESGEEGRTRHRSNDSSRDHTDVRHSGKSQTTRHDWMALLNPFMAMSGGLRKKIKGKHKRV